MKIDLTCPVELWHFKMPTQEDPNVYLHLFNLGEKAVNSVQAAFLCFDALGERLSRQVERVQGLHGEARSAFEMRVHVEDGLAAASLDFIIEKVWFTDGTVWRRSPGDMAEYTPNHLQPGKQLEELRRTAGEDALGYPSDQGAVWLCVCGRPNPAGSTECARCERDKHDVFTLYNEAAINTIIIERESALEEEARLKREEAARQEKERLEKEQKQKKRRKRTAVAAATLVLLSGAGYGVYFHGIPAFRYYQAEQRLKRGEFEAAKTAFLDIGDYRDSAERALESDYLSYQDAMKTGTLTSLKAAQDGFDTLKDFRDSKALAIKARYLRAEKLRESEAFEEALSMYQEVATYPEAAGKTDLTNYAWAKKLMENLQFKEAREKLLALGDYEDSANLAEECLLRPALTAMEDKDYALAITHFEQLPEGHQARLRIPEAHYLWGSQLFDEEKYDEAAEQFLQAGDYRDAWRRATECLYKPAVNKMQAGEYAEAKEMLDKIRTFEDAAKLSEECSYQLGLVQMKEENYEEAIRLLEEAPSVPLAQQVLREACYRAGLDKQQAEDNAAAAKFFEKAGDYQDAKERMQETLYAAGLEAAAKQDYDSAVTAFLHLDTYQNSKEELQKALYNRAAAALNRGEYTGAIQQLTALNGYGDSDELLKQAQYALAKQALDGGDLSAAADRFKALSGYQDADEQYKESLYRQAKALVEGGQSAQASPLLKDLQGYQDATELFQSVTYKAAEQARQEGDLSKAAELYLSLGDYQDAREQAESTYDVYYAAAYERAEKAIAEKDYKTAAEMLIPLDKENPGEKYADVKKMYQETVYRYAEELYNQGKPYEALPYYRLITDYKDVSTRKLTRYAYRVLGTWESSKGVMMVFRDNGTCTIDGKELYFVAGLYRLSTGTNPEELTYTHNITHMTNATMTLREEATKKLFKMKRLD